MNEEITAMEEETEAEAVILDRCDAIAEYEARENAIPSIIEFKVYDDLCLVAVTVAITNDDEISHILSPVESVELLANILLDEQKTRLPEEWKSKIVEFDYKRKEKADPNIIPKTGLDFVSDKVLAQIVGEEIACQDELKSEESKIAFNELASRSGHE